MQATLLPLFPLPVVVFPRTQLPLHIFEERYKEMVGRAIHDHAEFGVVLVREGAMVNMGCTVVVDRVLKEYPDGRFDIVTSGVRRFEILLINEEKSYLRGEVNFFDDEEPGPPPAPLQQQALQGYRELLQVDESPSFGEAALDDPQLSFQLAQGLQDVDFLQRLLCLRSEAARLKQVTEFLGEYVPKQRVTQRMKRLAPTNGHGPRPLER